MLLFFTTYKLKFTVDPEMVPGVSQVDFYNYKSRQLNL